MERGSNSTAARNAGRALVVLMLILIATATLTPADDAASSDWSCIICGEFGGRDAILNIALFVPLGVGLYLAGARFGTAVAIAFGTTLTVEALQRNVIPGRDAALGDIVMNTIGCAIGFWLMAYRARLLRPPPRSAVGLAAGGAAFWLLLQALSNYALVPVFPAETPHRAAAGRGLGGHYGPFPGRVYDAGIDDVRLVNVPYPAGRYYHNLVVREGSIVDAHVQPQNCSNGASAIVHVGDRLYREVLILALDDHHLRFGISTGYRRLRLSPLRFRLRDAFDPARRCQVTGDSVHIRAAYARSALMIQATLGSEGQKELWLTPRASQSWVNLLPFPWYLDGGALNAVLTFAWVGALFLPLAWWSARTGRGRQGHTVVAAGVGVVALIGFVAIPTAMGIAAAGPLDWGAAVVTLGLCWWLARRGDDQVVDPHGLLDR